MADNIEVQEWRDIPHKDKAEEIVIRFLITYADKDSRNVLNVGAEIFRAVRPDEKHIIKGLRFGYETPFRTVLSDRSIHGWLCWRTGMDVASPQQIMGRVEIDESWEINYWNYVGYMIGFGHQQPAPDLKPVDPDDPVPGPLPIPVPSDGMSIAQAHLDSAELFPFVYLKPWPKIAAARVDTRFFAVPEAVTKSPFYVALKSANAADKAQDAVGFIDDTVNPDDSPSYPNEFVTESTVLPSPYAQYLDFPSDLRRNCSYSALNQWVTDNFDTWEDLTNDLNSTDATTALTNIWNSCIALMVTLGYDQAWFAELIRLLQVSHLIDYVLAFQKEHPSPKDGTAPTPSDADLTRAIKSVMVLPDDIFPVAPLPNPADPPAITLYAVGAIRTVHYRPCRYVLGDVQRIETVQPGETRQETRRNLTRTDSENAADTVSEHNSSDSQDSSTSDLINQVQKTLAERKSTTAFDNYKTDYGSSANTMTVTGGWSVDDNPAGGYLKDISNFARDVVARSVSALRRETLERRSSRTFHEAEHIESRTLSNAGENQSVQSVYRWVNRQYELETHSECDRMVFEVFLDTPGAYLVEALEQYVDLPLNPPTSPADMGIKSYTDISPLAGQSGVYFLEAYQHYRIAPDAPPPPATRVISTGLKSRNPMAETTLSIPEGYAPTKAAGAVTGLSVGSSTSVVIGGAPLTAGTQTGQTLPFSGDLTADITAQNSAELWCSVISPPPAAAQGGALPAEGADEFTTYFVANIQVECARSDSTLANWQMETYLKIQAAYDAQQEQYQSALIARRHTLDAENPEFLTQLVQDQIIQATIAQFAETTLPTADDTAAKQQARNFEPRYAQFLRNALDWAGMTVDLIHDPDENLYLNQDQSDLVRLFSPSRYIRDFVRAKQVRLLISAKPDAARMLLLAYRTGQIWPCAEHLTPCITSDMSVIDQLTEEEKNHSRKQFDSWTITVPTAMVALSDQNL